MSEFKNIAVLMTCFNRRDITLRCLKSLFHADLPAHWKLHVWLVDDGSKDGTADAITAEFPEVSVIPGTGDLYWCGGMRLAWKHAAESDPDAYLWLNDDVVMNADALESFAKAYQNDPKDILIASCKSPKTGAHTYGGRIRHGWHPAASLPVIPDPVRLLPCDTFQGNLVFVPKWVVQKIGGMTGFKHAMADTDYGLRATREGIRCMVLPDYLATCEGNPNDGCNRDPSIPRIKRLKLMMSRKGLPPDDWWSFCKIHGGILAPLYFASPYLRVFLP